MRVNLATLAWLCDVCIQEGWAGQGISRRMLEAFDRHPDLQTLRRRCLATRDYHGLYGQFGHRAEPADRWTEKQCPVERWQAGTARSDQPTLGTRPDLPPDLAELLTRSESP